MATNYRQIVSSLPATPAVTYAAPNVAMPTRRAPNPAMGGGASPLATGMDPRSLVPVNRTQPYATDGGQARRLQENRMGTQPPSSFSGAGSAYAPASPPASLVAYTAEPAVLTAEGAADIERQTMYASATGDPMAGDGGRQHTSRYPDQDRNDHRGADPSGPQGEGGRMLEMLERFRDRMTPEQYASARARIEARQAARAAGELYDRGERGNYHGYGRGPAPLPTDMGVAPENLPANLNHIWNNPTPMMLSRADEARRMFAAPEPRDPRRLGGLLGG